MKYILINNTRELIERQKREKGRKERNANMIKINLN